MVKIPETKNLLPKVIELNHNIIKEYGGSQGLRDSGLLHSALDRASNALHYGNNTNPFDLATAYAYGISKNHPFTDGNKRTAFAVLFCFLVSNDLELTATNDGIVEKIVELASSKISESAFSKWIEGNTRENKYTDEDKIYALDILVAKYDQAMKELFSR